MDYAATSDRKGRSTHPMGYHPRVGLYSALRGGEPASAGDLCLAGGQDPGKLGRCQVGDYSADQRNKSGI